MTFSPLPTLQYRSVRLVLHFVCYCLLQATARFHVQSQALPYSHQICYVTTQLQPSVTVHQSMFHAMQGSELRAIPETQLSRFSPQRRTNPSGPYGGPQSVQIPSQAEAPQGNLTTPSQSQVQYRNTPIDWASNPNAQAGAPPQQTSDPLGVPPRTITLSENADLENVNPAVPVAKRDNAVKGGAPLASTATGIKGDPARALAEQSGPDTAGTQHTAHSTQCQKDVCIHQQYTVASGIIVTVVPT